MASTRNTDLPRVAIVGRPNVGKSSLFNRLLGRREAIVLDRPGVTRDRIERPCQLDGGWVLLQDTGGIVPGAEEDLLRQVSQQAVAAVEQADLLLLLVDGRAGITPLDLEIARRLRSATAPVLLVVNKIDTAAHEALLGEAWQLGLGEPLPISAEAGLGIVELVERIRELLGPAAEAPDAPDGLPDPAQELSVAIVGRPNVGKSSLVNRLAGEERVTVSSVPGTTRDAVDVILVREGQRVRLVDTAGLRKRARVEAKDEAVGIIMTRRRLERSHVAVLVIDATAGLTSGDVGIAGEILRLARPMVLAINKWDLVEDPETRAREFDRLVERRLAFLADVPKVTVSAVTGQRAFRLLDACRGLATNAMRRISTAELNRFLGGTLAERIAGAGSAPKMLYMTQTGVMPPRFLVFCRDPEAVPASLRRHLEARLKEAFGLGPIPVRIDFRTSPRR
ncbi:MAG: ribosome biogenesis GTPase Der [Acidobacteria bacterium]|nr:ribosome biogenesis GTPase Der [Acidobacteriota bacterium]